MGLLDAVAKATIKLMVREPFYGHVLMRVQKREDTRKDATISLGCPKGDSIQLAISSDYWKTLTTEALRYGAIKHQVLHLVFGHVLIAHKFGDAKLFDLAADLVVNQYLSPEQCLDGAPSLGDFPHLALRPNMDVAYYYGKLAACLATNSSAPDDEGDSDLAALHQHLSSNGGDDHSSWREMRALSDGERSILEGELHRLIRDSAKRAEKSRGQLPGKLQEVLDEIAALLEPEVPWKRILRLFSASSRRTSVRNTLRRPSKRYGTTPGLRIQRHQRLMVAIDTSGSVAKDELEAFFSEIHRIYKQGAEVIVVECDTDIGNTYTYAGAPPTHVSGRGGTSFEAPIRLANEKLNPDAVIYFTDGHAPAPETKSRKPILWIVSSRGLQEDSEAFAALPGRKVKMQR